MSIPFKLIRGSNKHTLKDSKKSTKVTIESVEYDLNKNIIAVLKYNIYEKVKGKSSLGEVDWEISFEGIGKFNITKGEWKSLKLISTTVLKGGYIQADKKQLIELYKLDTIPKQYQVEE